MYDVYIYIYISCMIYVYIYTWCMIYVYIYTYDVWYVYIYTYDLWYVYIYIWCMIFVYIYIQMMYDICIYIYTYDVWYMCYIYIYICMSYIYHTYIIHIRLVGVNLHESSRVKIHLPCFTQKITLLKWTENPDVPIMLNKWKPPWFQPQDFPMPFSHHWWEIRTVPWRIPVKISPGRNAFDVAYDSDYAGSHREVHGDPVVSWIQLSGWW